MSTLFPYTFTDKIHALQADKFDMPSLELPPSYTQVHLYELVRNLRTTPNYGVKQTSIKDIIKQKQL
jgi:hypothetical protein